MSKNITVDIDDIGASGDGIATVNGKRVFIPHSLPGEKVTAHVTKQMKEQSRAALVEVLHSSPERQTPPCPYFGMCGGCSLQHMKEDYYYAFKQKLLDTALRRAGFQDARTWPVVRIGAHSRRRVSFKCRSEGGNIQLGFFAEESRKLVDIDACLVLEPVIAACILPLKALLSRLPSVASIQEVRVALSDTGLDIVLVTSQAEPALYDIEQLSIFAKAENIARLSWQSSKGVVPILSHRPVEVQLGEARVELPVGSFQQASLQGQEVLTRAVLAGVGASSSVVDLYAGCGTYSFPLASQAKVHAVEGNQPMVVAMKKAISRYGYAGKITAEMRDIYTSPLQGEELKAFDAAVINPPRNGALSQLLALAAGAVPVIVIVSCNPATFARDARALHEAGYVLNNALGVDQFVFSHHLEMVGVFHKV